MSVQQREVVIDSVGQLMDVVEHFGGVFRGLPDRSYALTTTLDRFHHGQAGVNFERRLFVEFKQRARPYLRLPPDNDWEYLVVAQHYGLPTRLLDWTDSPLVAAHFATTATRREEDDADGVIWHLDWRELHHRFGFPDAPFTIDTMQERFCANGERPVWSVFYPEEHGEQPTEDFVLLLEPPGIDERMVTQQATFTLGSALEHPLDALLDKKGVPGVLTRFIIPRDAKPRIRQALDRCQVNERLLLPGMDGIARAIRREMAIPESPTRRMHEMLARSERSAVQRGRVIR